MKPNEQQELFCRIAAEYAEEQGARLKQQAAQLQQEQTPLVQPLFEKRLRRRLAALRWQRYRPALTAVAACLVLVLLLPAINRTQQNPVQPLTPQNPAPSFTPPAQEWAVIPLSCTLPDNLTLAYMEQDNEKSIYHLADLNADDVVLTLAMWEQETDFSEYTVLQINGQPVYGLAGQGYNLLTFVKDGIVYELTCKHDINTLVSLSETII